MTTFCHNLQMETIKPSPELKVCYNYFHVPGVDEKSLFRKGVVESVSNELKKIATPLDSPTISWTDIQELKSFLKLNPGVKFFKPDMRRDFFIGEIALTSGWFLALTRFLGSDNNLLLIFEDDLWLNNEQSAGINHLQEIIKKLPNDADLLFLYSPEDCFKLYAPDLDVNGLLCKHFSTWSTAFMLLTRVGAEKILTLFQEGVDRPLDSFLIESQKLIRYCLKPETQVNFISVYQRQWLGSTIDPREGQVPAIHISTEDLA